MAKNTKKKNQFHEIFSLYKRLYKQLYFSEMGMQCRICGKVFTRNQTLPFHRHLATHDTEPETVCGCSGKIHML